MKEVVLVIWHDAHSGTNTWVHLEDYKDKQPYVVNSVGWLVPKRVGGKRDHVTIAQSWSDDDAVDSLLHIPVAMVQEIVILEGSGVGNTQRSGKNRELLGKSGSKRRTRTD